MFINRAQLLISGVLIMFATKIRRLVVIVFTVFCLLSIIGIIEPVNVQKNTQLRQINNNDPFPANNPDPPDNAENVSTSINLSWVGSDPDGDELTYNIFLGTGMPIPVVKVVYAHETYHISGLEYNTKYYWRIDSYDNKGGATTGPTWKFTTRDDLAPFTPSNPSPANNTHNVSIFRNLSWNGGDPDNDPVSYTLYLGTNPTPPLYTENISDTSYNLSQLAYNTQYYWNIQAEDEYGYTTSGPTWTFTTEQNPSPHIPSNPHPSNGTRDVPIQLNISWTGGDPHGDNVTYDVYLGTNSNSSLLVKNLTVTMFSLPKLEYNKTYFWRIHAIDEHGLISISPLWTFTTIPNLPPYTPSNPIPENNETNVYIDAVLSWTGGDPNEENVTYDVYFGKSNNPALLAHNLTETFFKPPKMDITTTYYWIIVSWDEYNQSSSSPLWNFKTSIYNNSPPQKPSRPDGPPVGRPGISYTYSTSSVDSNGEPIFYKFDWDDGSFSEWIGPFNSGQTITCSHIWDAKGSYAIKVKAKDIYGGESFWSDPLPVSMPKILVFNQLEWYIQKIIERISILEPWLKII